jgi:hypothetical protein
MKYYILLLLSASVLLSSCDLFTNHGKKVAFGKNEVYYKGDGVTEVQAQKLGEYLEEKEYFDKKNAKSIQLTKDEDDYLVHFVVDEKKITNDARLNWWKLQYDLSKDVFDDKPVRIALANEKLEDLEVLNPIARYEVGKSTLYYDNSEIKKADAKKLADFFTEIKLMGTDKESDVFYQKEKATSVVRVVVHPKNIDDDVLVVFSYWEQLMREKVFDGKKAKSILTSTTYEDMDPLPKLTPEQREALENETTQTTDNTEATIDSLSIQTNRSGVLRLPNE